MRLSAAIACLMLVLAACGGSPPRRERVERPCVPVAWVDQARGNLAVQYLALGSDAWLALDLGSEHTVLYGMDRLAALGVRRGDRHVLVPPLFGSMPHELEVSTDPELPFPGSEGTPGFIVGRLGRESLEGRVVEIDTRRMMMCDRYADDVADVRMEADSSRMVAPFTGRRVIIAVHHGEATAGDPTLR